MRPMLARGLDWGLAGAFGNHRLPTMANNVQLSGTQERNVSARGILIGCAVLAVAVLILGSGCETRPSAAYGSSAWVQITNATQREIFTVARQVFMVQGYKPIASSPLELAFEKPGDFKNNFLYGGLDAGVVLRVWLKTDLVENHAILLHCRAKAVRNAGEKLEDEQELGRMDRSTFQPLLDEIKLKLNPPPPKDIPK